MHQNSSTRADTASPSGTTPSPAVVLDRLIGIVQEMVQDWDLPADLEIGASTQLVYDLCCSSVDIIGIVVAIEEEFGTRKLGFAELLFRDNRYVDDVTVGEMASFVARKLEARTP